MEDAEMTIVRLLENLKSITNVDIIEKDSLFVLTFLFLGV